MAATSAIPWRSGIPPISASFHTRFDSASPTADTDEPAASDPAASPSATPQESDDGGGVLIWVVGLGLAILVGAGAGMWVMRRTR